MRVLLAVALAFTQSAYCKVGVVQKNGRSGGWKANLRSKYHQADVTDDNGATKSDENHNIGKLFDDIHGKGPGADEELQHKYWYMAKNRNNNAQLSTNKNTIAADKWKLESDEFFMFMAKYMLRVEPVGRFKNTAVVYWSRDFGTPLKMSQNGGIQISGRKFNHRVDDIPAKKFTHKRIKEGKDRLCLKWQLPDKMLRQDVTQAGKTNPYTHPMPFIATTCDSLGNGTPSAVDVDHHEETHYAKRAESGKFGCVDAGSLDAVAVGLGYGTSFFGREQDAFGSNTRVMLRDVTDHLGATLCDRDDWDGEDTRTIGWGADKVDINGIFNEPGIFVIHHSESNKWVSAELDNKEVKLNLKWGSGGDQKAWWQWDGKNIRLVAPRWKIGRRYACLSLERFVQGALNAENMPFSLQQCDEKDRANFGCTKRKIKDPDCNEEDENNCKKITKNMFGLMKDAKENNYGRMIEGLIQGQYDLTAKVDLCDTPGAPNTPMNWNPVGGEYKIRDNGWNLGAQMDQYTLEKCTDQDSYKFTLSRQNFPDEDEYHRKCKDQARKWNVEFIQWTNKGTDTSTCRGYMVCVQVSPDVGDETQYDIQHQKWDPFLACNDEEEANWKSATAGDTLGNTCEELKTKLDNDDLAIGQVCWFDPATPELMPQDHKGRPSGDKCACTLGCTCQRAKAWADAAECAAKCESRGYSSQSGNGDPNVEAELTGEGSCLCYDAIALAKVPLPCQKKKVRHELVKLNQAATLGENCRDTDNNLQWEMYYKFTVGVAASTGGKANLLTDDAAMPNQFCEEFNDCASSTEDTNVCERNNGADLKLNYRRRHVKVTQLGTGGGASCNLSLGGKVYSRRDPEDLLDCPDGVVTPCAGNYVDWNTVDQVEGTVCNDETNQKAQKYVVTQEPLFGGTACEPTWIWVDC